VIVRERVYHDPCADPISQRALTLQERLLSPRLVIYSTHALVWQCLTNELIEGGSSAMLDVESERLEGAFLSRQAPDGQVVLVFVHRSHEAQGQPLSVISSPP